MSGNGRQRSVKPSAGKAKSSKTRSKSSSNAKNEQLVTRGKVKRLIKKKALKGLYSTPGGAILALFDLYGASLVHPFDNPGVKIPDSNTAPSTTFRTLERFNVTASASGAFCVRALLRQPYSSTFQTGTDPPGSGQYGRSQFTAFGTVSTPTTVIEISDPLTATATDMLGDAPTAQGYNQAEVMFASYSRMRLVSAELVYWFTGQTLNDQGTLVASSLAAQQEVDLLQEAPTAGQFDFNTVITFPGSGVAPVNTARMISSRYNPQGFDFFTYGDGLGMADLSAAVNTDGLDTNALTNYIAFGPPFDYGHLFIGGVGMAAGAPGFCTLCCNWEGQSWSNALQSGPMAPSAFLPTELSHGMNVAAMLPTVNTSGHDLEDHVSITPGIGTTAPVPGPVSAATLARMGQMAASTGKSLMSSNINGGPTSSSGGILSTIIDAVPAVVDSVKRLMGGSEGSSVTDSLLSMMPSVPSAEPGGEAAAEGLAEMLAL